MDLLDIARIVGGLILLVGGGELLVRGASNLAARIGISPLVVGLTVVSVATSAPELAVTVGAVLDGQPDLAVGNVVGSNIANVLLILGVAALVLPLVVREQLVKVDVPVMVGLSVALLLVALDGQISTAEGCLLLAAMIAHTVVTVVVSRRAHRKELRKRRAPAPREGEPMRTPLALLLLVVGVVLLVSGANLLVAGAVNIAEALGISGLVVGLTVVAVGTSLPELAASVIAAARGQRDLAVGNVVGSCIANIGLVLGLPAIISSGGLPVPHPAIALDIPFMIATSVALVPVVFTGFTVARWEGGMFVLLYAAYTTFVVLNATRHEALQGFELVMVLFVLPLVGITLLVTSTFEVGVLAERRRVRERVEAGESVP
ncbi:Inner membrane protein YrbG, predicted calcium/sodium:proton antiporter [Serinicoccus hydrothermalis]|uniref:Inner membrane protein YrbG, predicted calcium/sodium:proton antiporter n=1 Tax=Serinicoccus hydrothermalis TaxID=1758689 RepID=A0A1B1NBQ3_9MICO|nr:calcium/sodium antiporter [Serinicoccus hydrothermalis]ANS78852.1 Inner membrane protein YrbG, predicted calcium/sodium:proton antiporter [Serinicoccus hydrothermalis]